MLDVCLLGTAGMMPLPNRWLTSCLFRFNGEGLLVDCGEGTQVALREAGFSPNPISVICLTHYHADHVSGLPGFLLSMGNSDRTDPITIIGPKGLERVVNSLRVIAPELPFQINLIEITEPDQRIEILGYQIHAFKVNHNVLCYGYTIDIPRKGRFDVENAKALNIPVQLWNPLQKGNSVEYDGKVYTPDMVMGKARKGIKVTYCTDTRPTKSLVEAATDSDLLICEGMYAEKDKLAKAKQNKHMTFYEAAKVARDAKVKELWLTHYSPSLTGHKKYMKEVCEIFPQAHLGEDGKFLELDFVEE
ncbi:ribonuclease Z [Pseudobutyrivibrio sp.]|uniref:ribonuclease Z n=1 Tax=Pseudobutyrivibrio sp. TaxID=2014367 RepID=UPI001D7728D1|nr:ribonuclease Z [Pseudobutyrivibrio sp.]MBE5911585.1 ribonuclease Z [Pseudobutyrivibrio sp.]